MPTQRLPRANPESLGIASDAIRAFVDAATQEIDTFHSFQLVRHGKVAAEGWWKPWDRDTPHMLYSLSKSFTSTAAGLAISEGHFTLDDPVVKHFADDLPKSVSANLKAMRVRDLLRMGTGHGADTVGPIVVRSDGNWARGFLELPVTHEPGTHFVYNSGATYMVSALVQKTTGKRLLDYLKPRLFDPLGIENPTWEQCPRGIDTGGWGLAVRTDDIAKFAQLYCQDGVWNGKRLLPAGWVADATKSHIRNGDPAQPSDWNQGYGFQFWRSRYGSYRGDGAFGQYALIFPEHDAVLAITAGVGDMQGELNLVWKHLLPAFQNKPLPSNPAAVKRLRERLAQLESPVLGNLSDRPPWPVPVGNWFRPAPEKTSTPGAGLFALPNGRPEQFRLVPDRSGATLTIQENGTEHRIAVGHGKWRTGESAWRQSSGHTRTAARGGWRPDGSYAFRLCFVETPYRADVVFSFGAGTATLDYHQPLSFGGPIRATFTGRLVG